MSNQQTQSDAVTAAAHAGTVDMKLEVTFEKLDDKITLPQFRPAKG